MKKIFSFFKFFALSLMMIWAFSANSSVGATVYVIDLGTSASNTAFGGSNAYGAKEGTVNGVKWYINSGSCQGGTSYVWLGSNNATNYGNFAKLDAGLNGRGAAIANALGVGVTTVGYYAMAGENNILNVNSIEVKASATGGTAPTSMWCLYTTDNGATYTILDGVKTNPGTTLVTFTPAATIASAQYAFVWYSSAFGTYRAPKFEFFESDTPPPPIPNVVISGVYGGGGNSGAPFKNDYIELYNTTNSPIDLTGYTLYYTSANGTSANTGNTHTFVSGELVIGAKRFALLKAAAGTTVTTPWPIVFDFDLSNDATTVFSMAAGSGKILLLSTYTDLTAANSLPTTLAGIQAMTGYVDFVPYGASSIPAAQVFGSTFADLTATIAGKRKYNDVTKEIAYTFNVGVDFDRVTVTSTTPRNSSYGANQAATPTFSIPGGTYSTPQSVTISSTTPGAIIYYTTDGTTPTTSSSTAMPVSISATTTLKAIAVAAGFDNSAVATATYTIITVSIPNIVISGVYGGGGNTGAPFKNDYIELYNTTNSPIDLTGYTLYYTSANGTSVNTGNTHTFASGELVIGAKRFALLKAAAGTTVTTPWPIVFDFDLSNDATTIFSMAAGSGKILLLSTYTDLTAANSIPTSLAGIQAMAGYVDFVPYGATNIPAAQVFGSTFADLTATVAGKRKYNDVTKEIAYTFNVGVDFDRVTVTATTPRNSDYGVEKVATPTFNIPTGTYTTTQNITINCTTVGATIYYTTNGNNPTTTDAEFTGTPIPVSVNTTIKAMAVLVGMANSNVASATYTFPIEVANIGAFKTAHAALPPTGNNISNVPYKITGNVTYVERLGRNIYIKDATGGLLIFDNSPTSVITTTYNPGDVISGGVIGTCTRYNGMFEMIPLFNTAAGTPGTAITPTVLTMSNLLANFSDYESQLVKLETITFGEVKTLGLSSTAAGANVAILQGTSEMIMRNNYNTITGYETNPNSRFHVTGFIVPYVTTTTFDKQICPRDFNDIFEVEYTLIFKNWDNSVHATQTYHYGETVVPPSNPTRPADLTYTYTFNGWSPAIVTPVVGDATYTATYTPTYINYTLTVLASPSTAGNVTGGGTTFHYGDPATISATANTGYHFTSWNDGNTNATRIVTVTGNVTYTATFEPNTYTVVYDGNGANGGATASSTHTYNVPKALTLNGFTRTGHSFAGWATSAAGAVVYADGATVTNLATGGNYTLYAKWIPGAYTLTMNPSTGTCTMASKPVTYNQPIGTPFPNATQPCCPFAGWFIDGVQVYSTTIWTWESNKEAMARFNYPIKVTIAGGTYGKVTTPSGIMTTNSETLNYAFGANANYLFSPNPGAHIVYVTILDCSGTAVAEFNGTNGITADWDYDFVGMNKYYEISVRFAPNCYAKNVIVGTGAQVVMTIPPSTTPVTCIPHGAPALFTFTSSSCADITDILIEGIGSYSGSTFSIPSVTGPLPLIEVQTNAQMFDIVAGVNDPAMGSINPDGTVQYGCAATPTYTITKNLGYKITGVYIDGILNTTATATGTYTFPPLVANHTIDVVFESCPLYIIQFGPDASQNAGGVVYPEDDPTALYYIQRDSASSVKFLIIPDVGYVIDKVMVDGFNNTLAVQNGYHLFDGINKNHTITATFKKIKFTINATATAGGTINPPGAVQVGYGDDQPFTIAPNAGYHIVEVLVDGVFDQDATDFGYYKFFDVQANHAIHVVFAINTYTITPSAGANGMINPDMPVTVDHGANKKFDFIPNTGYQVAQVLVDGAPVAISNNSYTFYNVAGDHTIEVTFAKQVYTIVSGAGPNGTIEPLGVNTVEYWEHSEIYTFNPDPGYHIKEVLVDGANDPLAVFNSEHRFLNVSANHIIYVSFAKDEYTILATTTEGGTINPLGTVIVPHGEARQFFFSPDAGYKLSKVIVDGVNNEEAVATGTFIFPDVSDDHIISAQFERIGYVVTLPTPASLVGAQIILTQGSQTIVNYNGKFTFEVVLSEGYTQSSIVVRSNGTVVPLIGNEYVINNITADQTVTIEGLKKNVYQIEAKAGVGGDITPKGTVAAIYGESYIFTITPAFKYVIDDVKVNGESVEIILNKDGRTMNDTIKNIKANATITAYFKYVPITGVPENEAGIKVFSNYNVVTLVNEALIPVKQVEIMDMYGRLVWTGQATGAETRIVLDVAAGIYAVRVITEANDISTTKVSIIK